MGKQLLTSLAASTGIVLSLVSAPSIACSPNPYLGSICMVGFNFCPPGYAEAAGQLLQVSQYDALFSLFGTFYGGDGENDFALPDLRGRVPVNHGTGPALNPYGMGETGGVESVTTTTAQMPAHNHTAALRANSAGGTKETPQSSMLANSRRSAIYGSPAGNVDLHSDSIAIGISGSSQSQENRQPYLVIRYCVATQGVFPSESR